MFDFSGIKPSYDVLVWEGILVERKVIPKNKSTSPIN